MIDIKNISAGYGKEVVLKNVSVQIPKGKLISLIGPNGSGKSTLLKTALGIIPHSDGDVDVDGVSIVHMSPREIARKAAYLSQGRSIADMTVEQLVLHGRFPHLSYPRKYSANDRRIACDAMRTMGICELAGKPLASLSGGMRQKACIAMALAQETDYIFFDEPTTYLDISNRLSLMKILRLLSECGKGIVTVMHDLPLAFSFSDDVAVLKDGKLIGYGSPEEVYGSNAVKRAFGIGLEFDATGNRFYYKYDI